MYPEHLFPKIEALPMKAVDLKEKCAMLSEHWSPRIVADFNADDA